MLRKFICITIILIHNFSYSITVNRVIATIPVGVAPSGIAITPDGHYAYVANSNSYEIAGQDTISVLDLTNNTLKQTIYDNSFRQPYRIAINSAGTKAYVVNSDGLNVSIIDILTNTVIGSINGFDGPSGIAITPDGNFAYVNNYGSSLGVGSANGTTVNVVNLNTDTIVATITVGLAPASLAITPDGKFVYVINYVDGNPGTGTISIIQTSNNTVIGTIPGFFGPFSIAITQSGKYAYVTNFGSNNFAPFGTTVSVVDLTTNQIVNNINLAIQPSALAITLNDRFAFAGNYNTLYAGSMFTDLTPGQGIINIIDTNTNTVISPNIAVGESPEFIAISPTGEFAYVTNYTYRSVDVIALQNFEIIAQGCKIKNRFLTQIDFINKLSWSTTGNSLPVSYSIYRDAQLTDLASVVSGSGSLIFLDHNRNPNSCQTYYIAGTNKFGITFDPVAVTIK